MTDCETGLTRKEFLSRTLAAAVAASTASGIAEPATAGTGDNSRGRLAEIELEHRARLSSPQVDMLKRAGLNFVYGERRGARVQDAHTGRWYWDCHRLGSTYNLGHRHPEVLKALRDGLAQLEIGNFMLLSEHRTLLARELAATTDDALPGVIFTASGAEANEAALKASRVFTGRRRTVYFEGAYHGDTMATLAAGGDLQKQKLYRLESPDFVRIPFNDLAAVKSAVDSETAALIAEPTVAQLGFPEPVPGFWQAAARHCAKAGALVILDEVQTGGSATGTFWHHQQLGFTPDILVSGKWPSGGYFPNSFALLRKDVHDRFTDSVFMPHPSTFGGSELGCLVTRTVLRLLNHPAQLARVRALSDRFARGFGGAAFAVNRNGLCMALIDQRRDALSSVRRLADEGVLTIPALHHPHAVEFRPILTLSDDEADAIIQSVRTALA